MHSQTIVYDCQRSSRRRHLAGANEMITAVAILAGEAKPFVVSLPIGTGKYLLIHDRCPGTGLKNAARLLPSGEKNRAILFLGAVIGVQQVRFILLHDLDTPMARTCHPPP